MESIAPEFKDENEKNIVLVALIITMLTGPWIPGAIYFLAKNYFSPNAFDIFKAVFNFEIMLILVWVAIFILMFIVGVAGLLMGILPIAHLIVVLLAIVAIVNKKNVEIPVPLKLFQ